jgi:acyl-CoA reductase-like NAD-dependent aldehyde dehydrogenase
MTSVMRVPSDVGLEAKKLAAIQNTQPGELIARAWREYVTNHRDEFVADLEEAARLLRDGSLDDMTAFASRNARARAEEAAERARTGSD